MNNIAINKNTFDKVARHYDFFIIKNWMKKFNKSILRINFRKSDKILDISCGTGELLLELERKGMKDLYGLDISNNMLCKAKEKLKYATLKEGDVHELPYKDSIFDYVISTEALHHYSSQSKALQEMKRVCKNQGRVIVVDIDFWKFNKILEKFEPGCVKVNNRKEMHLLFCRAGFKIIKQSKDFLFSFVTIGTKEVHK